MSVVYGLLDPDTLEIRYVGITTYTPEFRLKTHINEAFNGGNRRVHKWIRSLSSKPVSVILEINPENLQESECNWISYLINLGARLTNGTSGGDGLFNPSPEVREKLSSWQRGRKLTPEHRAKLSEAQRIRFSNSHGPRYGKSTSDETKEKLRLANLGKQQSLATIEKRAASLRGKTRTMSEEARYNMSVAAKGRTTWNKGLHTGNQYTRRKIDG